ncbi:MAG: hypothetical protein QOH61_702 [Chloroflexota bacterium]|jgi:hypothetical protein|nr:hypothetical protein [Chloroflexota bacterium]
MDPRLRTATLARLMQPFVAMDAGLLGGAGAATADGLLS